MPIHSGNRYLSMSEMTDNAQYILTYLMNVGWTKNAVCGMLGNMQSESTINPAIWESLKQGNRSGGFGLVQWTPATKYINWANSNGLNYTTMNANLQRIIWEVANNQQWINSLDPKGRSFKEFTESTDSPYDLAMVFISAYERPKNPNQPNRGTQAMYWYETLDGEGTIIDDDGNDGENGHIIDYEKDYNKNKDANALIHFYLGGTMKGWVK